MQECRGGWWAPSWPRRTRGNRLAVVLSAFVLSASLVETRAETFLIDFNTTQTSGAYPDASAWNIYAAPANINGSVLSNTAAAASGITLSYSGDLLDSTGAWTWNGNGPAWVAADRSAGDFFWTGQTANNVESFTLVFSGLTAGATASLDLFASRSSGLDVSGYYEYSLNGGGAWLGFSVLKPDGAAETAAGWNSNNTKTQPFDINADGFINGRYMSFAGSVVTGATLMVRVTDAAAASNATAYSGINAMRLQVTAPMPDIAVLGTNGAPISNGDTSPNTTNGTDFGVVDLTSNGVLRTFTITNTAVDWLSLTDAPPVRISGAHATDFTVTAQPATLIAGGASSTFVVKFAPRATGVREATLSIASTDVDESPYTFALRGAGAFNTNGYPFKMRIQFSGYTRGETLTNFPALVVMGGQISNFNYSGFLSAAGGDLRFTDDSMSRLLNHEVETWNTNGNSFAWVQVPSLANTNTAIWAMWGNAADAVAPMYTTNGATWSEQYAGVWHLAESSGLYKDSASTNNGTLVDVNASSERGIETPIGRGLRFVGGGDFIEIANESNFKFTSGLTLMVWARGLADGDAWSPWIAKNGESAGYALRRRGAGSPAAPDWVTRGPSNGEQNGPTISGSEWHFISGTISTGATKTKRLFINGQVAVESLGVTGNISDTPDNLLIGARTNSTAYWAGYIDEVRVSRIARSTNWVWAEYATTASNANLSSYGAVVGGPEMAVLGTNAAEIANGSASPATINGTDFGSVTVGTSTYLDRTFTITNSGNAVLTLQGAPIVSVSGDGDFSVVSGPLATNLSPGQKTTFTVRFLPLNTGSRMATVSIGSNDGDENPYTFQVAGAGTIAVNAFTYSLPLRFCGYSRSETLTNFPALVILGTNVPGFSYATFAGDNGGDLRFSDHTKENFLNFEIESWNTNGISYVWVQVPALSGTNTTIHAFWGNTNAVTLPATSTNGAVWSQRYAGVWHLAELSGNSRDSTTNALHGVSSNGVTQAVTGQVGRANDFSGSGSRTFLGRPVALNTLTQNFTVSSWIRPAAVGGNRVIFGAHWGSFNGWSLRLAGANLALERLGPNFTYNSGTAITASQWAAVSAVYDIANNVTFYINGAPVATVAGDSPASTATQPWSLGANDGDNFSGIIDEVQVSSIARSSNWIWAAYRNSAAYDSFVCAGPIGGPGNLIVLGTNLAEIASGSATAAQENGTDFDYVPASSFKDMTFFLTNAGVGTLTISGVATSGPHRSDFSVRSFPTTIPGQTASNMVLRFTPSVSGTRTAVVAIASNDEDTPSYTFTVVGRASTAGIMVTPTNGITGSIGSAVTRTLAVTNIGEISSPYSFTSDVPWIVSADAGLPFVNPPQSGRQHDLTINFTNPICAAGVYTGRVIVTAPYATNSPFVVTLVATVTPPAPPTSVSATASGQEMVKLAWQPAGGNPVLIAYREGVDLAAEPEGCSNYLVGSSFGGGSVIYLGNTSALDHVVAANASHYYRLYSVVSGQFYSAATAKSAVTEAYGDGLIIAESFAYTNGLALAAQDGGLGWTNAWSASAGYLISTDSLDAISGFTGGYGNAADCATGEQIFRGIPEISAATGRRYVSFQMRYDGSGYAGLSFFDGDSERVFIGQKSGANEFGFVYYDGSSPTRGVNTMTTGKTYTVVAMLDIAGGAISASIYTNESEALPATEPATWQVTGTGPTNRILNRIRLGSGVGVTFDEIRIGHTWRDVVASTPYALDVLPASLTFHTSTGVASSNNAFQVFNGAAGPLGYTNAVTYGAGASGWLQLSATSGVAGAFSSVTHTAHASALGGGAYVATNRFISSAGTVTQVITVVVSGVSDPTAVAVAADGPQLRRLTWSDSGAREVLVVYRNAEAPASNPVQGQSYNVGDVIPGNGGTVIAKAIGTNIEHVATAGSTGYYKFFAINAGIYYSTGVLVSAATPGYPADVIVDQLSATQGVSLASVSSGQGWSGAWSVSNAAGAFTVVTNAEGGTPTFDAFPGFPTNFANRIRMTDQGSGRAGSAQRSFNAITSGQVYVSSVISYQYPGALKFAGISLMSGGAEKLFLGETRNGEAVLGIENFGGGGTHNTGYGLNIGTAYTIIGAYDIATREFKAMAYHSSETIPAGEPATWLIHTNLEPGRLTSLDGIRLVAGCDDPLNTVGYAYFDEVRVARTWASLVQQSAPALMSYSLNGGAPVTDAQMTSGAWSVTMVFSNAAGIAAGSLNYDLFTTNSAELASDVSFATVNHTFGGTLATASNSAQAAISSTNLYLGRYYLRWSAENSNGVGVVNSTVDRNNQPVSFMVVDDDTDGPVASAFNISGGRYTNVDLVAGLLVTGLIQDVGSGIFGGASNRYVLYRNGNQVSAGPFDVAPASDGAARLAPEPLSVTLPGSVVTNVGSYSFVVFSRDVDNDRPDDTAAGSNSFQFSVSYFGCPPDIPPTILPVTDKTAYSNSLLTFTVTANDSNCVAPMLSATGLPTGAMFTTVVSGDDRIGTFTWVPQTVGTFPVRFVADDGVLSSSVVIKIFVGYSGEAVNDQGIPHSQTNWSVAITELKAPSSGNATVVWQSVEGVTYDLYSSTAPIGGGASWSKIVSGQEAGGVLSTASVVASGSARYYQVVPQGSARADRGVWGIARPTIPSALYLMAPPLLSDRSFADTGAFGNALAAAVPDGALVHIATDPTPNWLVLEKSGGVWRTDPGNAPYNTPLAPGQAFFIQYASGAKPIFSGPVGNVNTQTLILAVGHNIIGVSEGKGLAPASAFGNSSMDPDPIGNYNEDLADQLLIQHAGGTWRRLIRQPNGTWYDTQSRATTSVTLMPGEAYYYIRRASSSTVSF